MSRKKKNKGLILFNKCAKAVRKDFKKQGKEISWNEAQKWTSKNVFPKFQGQDPRNVKIADINAVTNSVATSTSLFRPKVSPCFDPRAINPADIQDIEWWNIGVDGLAGLPDNVNVRVNGGDSGMTDILPKSLINSDINIKPIVENIRIVTKNRSGLVFSGLLRMIDESKSQDDPCNLFIDFQLTQEGTPVIDDMPIPVPTEKVEKESDEKREARLKAEAERKKEEAKINRSKRRKRPKQKPKEDKKPKRRKVKKVTSKRKSSPKTVGETESVLLAREKTKQAEIKTKQMQLLLEMYKLKAIDKAELKAELKKLEKGGQI